MKKTLDLRGVGAVYRYTVIQHYKTPSVIIFLLVLVALSLAAFPVLRTAFGGPEEVDSTEITVLYLCNETGFLLDKNDILSDERYAQVQIEETAYEQDAINEKLLNEPQSAAVVVTMDESNMGFAIKGYHSADGQVTDGDLLTLNNIMKEALHEALLRSMNVTQEQAQIVRSRTYSEVASVSDYLAGEKDNVGTDTRMMVNMFYSYMIVIFCTLAMSYIFQLCMEEKVSKLVETLLVSVSPTALLVGKVLAVTTFIFGGIGLIVVGLCISYRIAASTGDVSFVGDAMMKTFSFDIGAVHISAGTLLLLIPCLLLAYLIGAMFSAIAGSCCSKTEDTQHASLAVVMFLMIGYFAGTFTPMIESDAVDVFCALFPLTSIFVALPNYICGKIPLAVFLIALVLQAGTVYLLARTAGAVYRMMLLYRGGVPKPAQLFKMLKEQRAANKAAVKGEGSSHAE